jgi:hypothetical protein
VGFAHKQSAIRAAERFVGLIPQVDREVLRADSAEVLVMARAKALQWMDEGRAGAIADVVRVEQRLAALLGWDAPQETIVYTPTQGELDAWVATMVTQSSPALGLLEADVIDVDSDE